MVVDHTTVLIVGAGPAGLAACRHPGGRKRLRHEGTPFQRVSPLPRRSGVA